MATVPMIIQDFTDFAGTIALRPCNNIIREQLVGSLRIRIGNIKQFTAADGNRLTESLTSCNLPQASKDELQEAIDQRIGGAAASSIVAKRTVGMPASGPAGRDQVLRHPYNYFTAKDYACLDDPHSSTNAELMTMVRRYPALGVQQGSHEGRLAGCTIRKVSVREQSD